MAEIDFPDTLVDLCSEHVFPVSPAFFASPSRSSTAGSETEGSEAVSTTGIGINILA